MPVMSSWASLVKGRQEDNQGQQGRCEAKGTDREDGGASEGGG